VVNFVTAEEAAALLRVSARVIYRRWRRAAFTSPKRLTGALRIESTGTRRGIDPQRLYNRKENTMKKRNPRTKLIALVIAMIAVIIMIASAAGEGQPASQFEHWLPDGTKIVFTSDGNCFALVEKVAFSTTRDNPNFVPIQNAGEIYLMNPDGSDPERITNNLWADAFAVLSPDGKKIIFDNNRFRLPTDFITKTELFVMKTDGTEETHLTDGSSGSWAPDSKHIAFAASASGTGTMIRDSIGAPTTDGDIFILNVDDATLGTQAPVNITNSPTLIEADPHWSPDGQKVVYAAHDMNDDPNIPTTAEIFVVNVDGSGVPVQLTHNTSEERAPAWSPDGSKIVFMCRYGGTDFEICTINPDGSGLVQLTNNTVQELSIRWSVHGTQFWFQRPVSGRNQLFKINADGTGETQMTNTVGINVFPTPGWLRVHDCKWEGPGRRR
jgi:TolB protein